MKCGEPGSTSSGARYLRKETNENERRLYENYWQELTNMYGTYIDFWVYEYSLSAHDFFYGEHPLAPFTGPVGMNMLVQFQNDSLLLSKFGIMNDADATFIVPIKEYRERMGANAEPKAGDLIQMTELGWDRPGGMDDLNLIYTSSGLAITSCDQIMNPLDLVCSDLFSDATTAVVNCSSDSIYYSTYQDLSTFDTLLRGAPVFEITERRDQDLTMHYNILLGHYVWILHAKRFDYSYQPNAPREPRNDQVSDETLYGKLTGGTNYPEEPKRYDQNTTDESNKEWDYSKRPGNRPDVYGGY